jgi:hypothetical protein
VAVVVLGIMLLLLGQLTNSRCHMLSMLSMDSIFFTIWHKPWKMTFYGYRMVLISPNTSLAMWYSLNDKHIAVDLIN